MSLFGSIGIGPVRVGASTSSRRSSGGIGGGVGFLVILALILMAKYWYVVLPIVLGGALLAFVAWAVMFSEEGRDEERIRKAAIIERAESQHARLMDGDEDALYGEFPPADL